MKNQILLTLVILLTLTGMTFADGSNAGEKCPKIFLKAGYNMLMQSDSDSKEIYGDQLYFPEFKAGFHFSKKVYLFAGFGTFSKSGEIAFENMSFDADMKQTVISGGLGFRHALSKKIDLLVEAGAAYFKYEEEALELKAEDNAIGFRGELGLAFNFSKNFFIEIFGGYMSASDTIDDKSIKLGGLVTGGALGIRF